jgi:hypothetical protein
MEVVNKCKQKAVRNVSGQLLIKLKINLISRPGRTILEPIRDRSSEISSLIKLIFIYLYDYLIILYFQANSEEKVKALSSMTVFLKKRAKKFFYICHNGKK